MLGISLKSIMPASSVDARAQAQVDSPAHSGIYPSVRHLYLNRLSGGRLRSRPQGAPSTELGLLKAGARLPSYGSGATSLVNLIQLIRRGRRATPVGGEPMVTVVASGVDR